MLDKLSASPVCVFDLTYLVNLIPLEYYLSQLVLLVSSHWKVSNHHWQADNLCVFVFTHAGSHIVQNKLSTLVNVSELCIRKRLFLDNLLYQHETFSTVFTYLCIILANSFFFMQKNLNKIKLFSYFHDNTFIYFG